MSSLRAEDLRKRYRDETVLHGVDVSVEPGELCMVVGPSGCGKTTLLECLAGLEEPDDGRVYLGDRNVTDVPVEDRRLGLVFQEFETALFPHMTVAENVAFGLRQGGTDYTESERETLVEETLEMLAIEETWDSRPDELSGGQQQRVELARQLVRDTAAMLLDDPLADLDYKLQKRMERELRDLQREAEEPFLQVTHNQERALRLADRIVVMNDGQIEQVGTPDDVYHSPANAFVGRFVGDSNLLEGTVETVANRQLTVDTPAGRMTAAPGTDGIEAGADVVLLIRPEAVALDVSPDEFETAIEVTYEGRTYTGTMTEFAVTVEADGDPIELRSIRPGEVSIADATPGDDIMAAWAAQDAMAFAELSVTEKTTLADLRRF